MKIRNLIIGILLGSMSLTAFADSANDKLVKDMAAILLHLEFYASFSDKRELKKIAANENYPENDRILARSIVNIEHRALESDLPDLKKIMNDESASVSEQEMAYIISRLKYKPSKADKKILRQIIY